MRLLGLVLAGSLVLACSVGCTGGWPQARLDLYVGAQRENSLSPVLELPKGSIQAGLWVLNDTGAPDAAPKLSEASFTVLTRHVQHQLMRSVPIEVVTMKRAADPVTLQSNFTAFLQWGKDHQLDYLIIAILSSAEIEVPERFPWRGSTLGVIGRGLLLGYRAENLALAELALVDVSAGNVLIRVHGYAWASLEGLDVPIESNGYPVVRRNIEDPPLYSKKEEDAHDVMRAVAGHDAVNQAVMHLKEAWRLNGNA